MQNGRHYNPSGIIAVLGPEGAGKRTLLSNIDPSIPKNRDPFGPDPIDCSLRNSDYQALENYILRIYSNFDHIKQGYPERNGLLIFSFKQVLEFSRPDALQQYSHFLEYLQKFAWLNVSHYIMAITHIDHLAVDDLAWVDKKTNSLKCLLERIFSITIEHYIPLSRQQDGTIENLFDKKPGDHIDNNKKLTLLWALNSLVTRSSPRKGLNPWVVGRLGQDSSGSNFIWKTIHQTRGKIEPKNKIRILPSRLEGSIDQDYRFLPATAASLDDGQIVINRDKKNSILVSADSTAKTTAIMDLRAILQSDISPFDLQNENRSFTFTFFGPQTTEGEIDRCNPANISSPSQNLGHYQELIIDNKETIIQSLGQETNIRISCRNANIVVDIWNNDFDAGNVLIWDDRSNDNVQLIGIGRIIGFPDTEIQDCVEKLMLFDRFRLQKDFNNRMLSYELERVFHNFKRFLENKATGLTLEFIEKRIDSFNKEFDPIFKKTVSIQDRIKTGELPDILRNLHAHLDHSKKKLSKQYNQIADLIKVNAPHHELDRLLHSLHNEHIKNVEFIRKHNIFPIWSCVSEAIRSLSNEMKTKVTIHNQIPRDWAYFPENPQVLENVYEALCQLFDNSRTHAHWIDDIKVDVFIDPPSSLRTNSVCIQYQDNGVYKKKTQKLIEKSEGGLRLIKRKLEDNGAGLSPSGPIGLGTSYELDIPVWSQKSNRAEALVLEVLEILNAVDYEILERGEYFQDYLRQFEKILLSWSPESSFKSLYSLLADAAKHNQADPNNCEEALERISFTKESDSIRKLRVIGEVAHQLRFSPILDVIHTAIAKIRTNWGDHRIHVRKSTKKLPYHRVKSYRNHEAFRAAMDWFFLDVLFPHLPLEKRNKIVFDLKHEGETSKDRLRMRIGFPEIKGMKNFTLPITTRLIHLGIEGNYQKTLELLIPIQIIEPEGEP